jgi:N utilization substance protein B
MKGSRRLSHQTDADEVLAQISDKEGFAKADQAYLESLVRGVVNEVGTLREKIGPHLDRPIEQLSPVEHALLLMAACELSSQPGTPYRVVINEAVELAKVYGGTDGHKYVNGVLDKLAPDLRPGEAATRKSKA